MNNLLDALRRGAQTGGSGGSSLLRHAYNAGRFSYYSGSYPFINVTKNAGAWLGPDVVTYSATGWPVGLAVGDRARSDVAFDMDPEFGYFPPGDYVVKTTANVSVVITDNGDNAGGIGLSNIVNGVGQATFTVSDVGAGNWATFGLRISLRNDVEGAPIDINDLYCCLASEEAALIGGAIFKEDYLALYAGARVIRFLDWLGVNGRWGDCVRYYSDMHDDADRYSYAAETGYPVPISICMEFAKQIGAEPMISMPSGYASLWFGFTESTNKLHNYAPDFSIAPHGLNNGERVLIGTSSALPACCAPLVGDTIYYVINATTYDYQLSATMGGSPIVFTWGGGDTSMVETEFNHIATVEPDQYNDLFLPFMLSCYATYPNTNIHVTWTNEFWNSNYAQTNITLHHGSFQAVGSLFSPGAGAGYNLVRVWKAAEDAGYGTAKTKIIFENQAAFPTNPWSTVWDYVDDTDFYGTGGQTIAQIFGDRLDRSFYSFAPYGYLDYHFKDYDSAGYYPDFVYANNGNSFVIPDSYWDGLMENGLLGVVDQCSISMAYAQSKCPGIKGTTYEWGIAFSVRWYSYNTHNGGAIVVQSIKSYLDGPRGRHYCQAFFEGSVIDFDLYCANQLLGPQGWSGSESGSDPFGFRDAIPSHTSQRWTYFQSV